MSLKDFISSFCHVAYIWVIQRSWFIIAYLPTWRPPWGPMSLVSMAAGSRIDRGNQQNTRSVVCRFNYLNWNQMGRIIKY